MLHQQSKCWVAALARGHCNKVPSCATFPGTFQVGKRAQFVGYFFGRTAQTDKALQYYENLVNKHPDYVGTYYHLGKLYEALNRKPDAISTYEKGMEIAKQKRDNHAFSELQAVYRELAGIDEDDY